MDKGSFTGEYLPWNKAAMRILAAIQEAHEPRKTTSSGPMAWASKRT